MSTVLHNGFCPCGAECFKFYAPDELSMRVQHGDNPECSSHWFPTAWAGGNAIEHRIRFEEWLEAVHSRTLLGTERPS